MADRAVSDDNSPEGVVDLINDDRWQARLEEARARREIALREKGKDPSASPKRKIMPWEQDAAADAKPTIDPIIQVPDSDRVDFADRVDKVRENVAKDEEAPAPIERASSRSSTIPLPTTFEDLLTDEAFEDDIEDEIDWAPPPKKRHSAINEDAPDVIELASRYASTLTPGANAGSVDVFDAEAEVDAKPAAAPVVVRNHPPSLLILGIVALAAMPFAVTVPPLERGPAMPDTPTLRLQPALGFTTAMLWRPVETSSSQWQPASTWSLPLSTVYSPRTPTLITEPDAMAAPDVGEATAGFLAPLGESALTRSIQPPVLDGAAVDRLPGAFSRRPVPRPLAGEPVVSTRAPSRLPAVETGNESSPRVAPGVDNDSTLLDQVTALTTVVFDRAPVIADRAIEALSTPAPTAAPAAETTVAAPENVLQLTILIPTRADSAVAGQFADDAVARGHSIASIKDVDVSISARNLRYFHEADRAEAERLAQAYGAEARSFTWFTPKPTLGTVELWLEGRASPPVRVAPVVRRAEPAPTPAPTPQVVIVRKPEGLLSRLLGGHRVGSTTVGGSGDSSSQRTVAAAPQAPTTTGTGTDTGTDTGGTDTGSGTGTTTGTDTGTGTDTTGTDTGTGTGTGGTDTTGTGTTGGTDTSGGTGSTGGTDTSGDTSGTGGDTSGGDTSGSGGSGSTGSDDSGGSTGGGSTGGGGSSGGGGASGGGSSGGSGSSDP